MTFEAACKLLGVTPEDSLAEVKTKYRKLVMQVHPDTGMYAGQEHQLDIAEVTDAYDVLVKHGSFERFQAEYHKSQERKARHSHWEAPVHPNAFAPRDVFQYVEDQDGERIGTYRMTSGNYYWNPEVEEFSLFLKSIFQLANQLFEQAEEQHDRILSEEERFRRIKELNYLLAGQYTDLEAGLEHFAKEVKLDKEGRKVFYLPAFLELPVAGKTKVLCAGESIAPLQLKEHRLYLGRRNTQGTFAAAQNEILGYLSFQEDPLYYVLIPMFENHEVQVKLQIAEDWSRKKNYQKSVRLHLWVRRKEIVNRLQEDVNSRIGKLLCWE